jgi:hypothetical protein
VNKLAHPFETVNSSGKILTVPEEIGHYQPYYLTGNEYVALPLINPETGGLDRVNVLHMGTRGLLEFCGSSVRPLIEPYVEIESTSLTNQVPESTAWVYEQGWLPRFSYTKGELAVCYKIVTPPDTKGFAYIVELKNRGTMPLKVTVGFQGHWEETLSTIYTSKHPWGQNCLYNNPWSDALTLEFRAPTGIAALAFGLDYPSVDWQNLNSQPVVKAVNAQNPPPQPLEFCFQRQQTLPADERTKVVLYCGVNLEGDGAGTALVDLRRRGWENLHLETSQWLQQHYLKSSNPRLEAVLNLNLFFNYYYSQGKTIDTEELVLVTSRSPRYYVSAAYWPRDTFLWSFPAILIVNPQRAKQTLLTGFRRHLSNAGIHSHYLNGVVLYPGFELDQLCAYTLALNSYWRCTGDQSILELPEIYSGLVDLLNQLALHQSLDIGLYSTFLDPSDDPVTYPFLTYSNVLVWRMFNCLAELSGQLSAISPPPGVTQLDKALLLQQAEQLKTAIYQYCVVLGPYGRMFVWSTNAQGNYELYDNPPGSLLLLAHYSFCNYQDEVYLNTLRWVFSPHNSFYNSGNCYSGLGSLHAGNPWLLAACNTLLATRGTLEFADSRQKAWELLLQAPLDNGLACETIDPTSGMARTGLAFATCAGFLAYTLSESMDEVNTNGEGCCYQGL